MRTLIIVRPNAATRPGGDLVHAQRTAEALRRLDVHVDILPSATPDASGYDVAHVFGIFEPDLAATQLDALRQQGKPVVLSPIWLDLSEYFTTAPKVERALADDDVESVKRRLRRVRDARAFRFWRDRREREAQRRLEKQRQLVARADVLLPASDIEARLYVEKFAPSVPMIVAPLGVDTQAFDVPRAAVRAGVLCAARIESKKNQAALLYGLRDVDVDVTLVGDAYDERYLALCRRWATPRTTILPHASHAEVLELMARAAVHAHPSWFESPGLSSLEAAGTGAQLVVGNRGTEPEYFDKRVEYADPADPTSIREAVLRALRRGRRESGDELELRVRAFTWERAAQATLQAYRAASTT